MGKKRIKYLKFIINFLIIVIFIAHQGDNFFFRYAQAQVATTKKEERISLDLKGIDIIDLFRILSIKTGITLVPSKGVAGRVNVFLNNLTFEDALDVVMLSQDLACEKEGNVLHIMTDTEYKTMYGKPYNEKRKFRCIKLKYGKPSAVFAAIGQLKSDIGKIIIDESTGTVFLMDIPEKLLLMEKSIIELDKPMEMQIFDLNYAKTQDAKAQLSSVITPGAGQVVVDERSSKVMVTDLPEKMTQIRRIVKALDAESKQVFMEVEIAQVILSDQFQRGVDWDKIVSSLKGLQLTDAFALSSMTAAKPSMISLVKVGTLATDNFSVLLGALESYGDIKILSRPRITALNNQEAKVLVGTRDAYVTATTSQSGENNIVSETIEFIDIGVKLNVVPNINEEGFVTMKIKAEISSSGGVIISPSGNSRIPIVETSEAETTVKIKDGTMLMIGGLIKDEKRDEVSGTPFLSKIPILGTFFGTRTALTKKTELVIFLTPYIISGDATVVGTEPEKMLPPDIISEERVKSIFSKKIEEISINPKAEIPAEERPKTEQAAPQVKVEPNVQDRLRGIKEY